jgi:hypothetical protein
VRRFAICGTRSAEVAGRPQVRWIKTARANHFLDAEALAAAAAHLLNVHLLRDASAAKPTAPALAPPVEVQTEILRDRAKSLVCFSLRARQAAEARGRILRLIW